MSALANQLEKKIIGKINAIANNTQDVKGSGVNELLTKLRQMDEVCADGLQKRYLDAVRNLKK